MKQLTEMKQFLAFNLLILTVACVHADVATRPPPVPQEISSFGACVSDGYVYVYGGHTGASHEHSRDNLSADFLRYPLSKPDAAWEKLPEDQLFNSGMDGTLYSLDPAGSEWAVTPVNHQHGRIFHRSVPVGNGLFWTIADQKDS